MQESLKKIIMTVKAYENNSHLQNTIYIKLLSVIVLKLLHSIYSVVGYAIGNAYLDK